MQAVHQWLKQARATRHPVALGGSLDVNAGTGVNLSLSIQRQVIAVFAHQYLGQQAGAGHATVNRPTRRRRLADRVALGAGKFRTDVADDLETAGLVVQHFRDVLPNLLQTGAACTAFAIGGAGAVNHVFAGKVLRQSGLR